MSSNPPSVPHGGAAPLPSDFEDAIARARSRFGRLASSITYFPVIDSTNDVALVLAAKAESDGVVVVAEEQRAGRGRRGRAWFSPPGSGLYVSVVLTPGRSRGDASRAISLLTLAAGVALAEAVEAATGLVVSLKWPNDLQVARRKLAGILAEAAGGHPFPQPVVVGYGINVSLTAYPPALRDRTTSLEAELGRPADRAHVFVESIASLARRYDDLLEGRFDAILDAWRARAPTSVGTEVVWTTPAGRQSGVTAGIDADGALLVRVGQRVERIVAGDIQWA